MWVQGKIDRRLMVSPCHLAYWLQPLEFTPGEEHICVTDWNYPFPSATGTVVVSLCPGVCKCACVCVSGQQAPNTGCPADSQGLDDSFPPENKHVRRTEECWHSCFWFDCIPECLKAGGLLLLPLHLHCNTVWPISTYYKHTCWMGEYVIVLE